jgi:hypothetical protein
MISGILFLIRMYHDDMIKVYSVIVIEASARATANIEPYSFLTAQPSINKLTRL